MKHAEKKHSVKGMTLIEILISMVVFVVISLMLAQIGETINNIHRNSVKVNERVTLEKPYAVNGYYNDAADKVDVVCKDMKVTVKFGKGIDKSVDLKGDCYKTKADVDTFSDADLQFVNIDYTKVLKYKKDGDFYIVKDSSGKEYKRTADGKYFEMDGVTPVDSSKLEIEDVISIIEDSNLWSEPEAPPKSGEGDDGTDGT